MEHAGEHWGVLVDRRLAASEAYNQQLQRQLEELQAQVRNIQKASQQQFEEVRAQVGNIQRDTDQKASQQQLEEVQAQVGNIQRDADQKASQQQLEEVQNQMVASQQQLEEVLVQVRNIHGDMDQKASQQHFTEVRAQVGNIQGRNVYTLHAITAIQTQLEEVRTMVGNIDARTAVCRINSGQFRFLPDWPTVAANLASNAWGRIRLDLKTNIAQTMHICYFITIVGSSYNDGKPVHCEAVGHIFQGTFCQARVVNGHGQTAATSTPYDGEILKQYFSEDGFLVLKMAVGYYCVDIGVSAMLWSVGGAMSQGSLAVTAFARRSNDHTDL